MDSKEMNTPAFSVVIPTFNRASFIKKTIESVLVQTIRDFEIIVVDDGSTDETAEVVRAIADPRLFYHFKANEERAVARNTGTFLSRGKYVTYFDSDDELYDNHLEIASELIEERGSPELFHLGFEIKDEVAGITRKVKTLPPTANSEMVKGNYLSCNGVFLRSDIARRYPFNPDRNLSGTEDYELWLRLASRFPIYCDNRVTSIIVQHDGRSVVNTNLAKLEKRIQLLEKYLVQDGKFSDYFSEDMSTFKANNRVYIALHLALAKERVVALTYLIKALLVSPKVVKNRAFFGTIKRIFI